MITEEELKSGNTLIIDFLDWEWHEIVDGETIWIPNMYPLNRPSTGSTTYNIMECRFDTDWNWTLALWDSLHRQVCIPMMKDNKHLRCLRPLIQQTKKLIVWCYQEDTYRNLIKIIKFYNKQFS